MSLQELVPRGDPDGGLLWLHSTGEGLAGQRLRVVVFEEAGGGG